MMLRSNPLSFYLQRNTHLRRANALPQVLKIYAKNRFEKMLGEAVI